LDLASLKIEFAKYVETCGFMTAVDLVVTYVASKVSTQALQDANALYWSKLAVQLE
jgi:putative flippase GtrA